MKEEHELPGNPGDESIGNKDADRERHLLLCSNPAGCLVACLPWTGKPAESGTPYSAPDSVHDADAPPFAVIFGAMHPSLRCITRTRAHTHTHTRRSQQGSDFTTHLTRNKLNNFCRAMHAPQLQSRY